MYLLKMNNRTTGNSISGERIKYSHLLKTEMKHFELGKSTSKDKQNKDSKVSMANDNQEGVEIFARKVLFICTYLSSFKNGSDMNDFPSLVPARIVTNCLIGWIQLLGKPYLFRTVNMAGKPSTSCNRFQASSMLENMAKAQVVSYLSNAYLASTLTVSISLSV